MNESMNWQHLYIGFLRATLGWLVILRLLIENGTNKIIALEYL